MTQRDDGPVRKIVPPRKAFVIDRCGWECPSIERDDDEAHYKCCAARKQIPWVFDGPFPDFCPLEDAK